MTEVISADDAVAVLGLLGKLGRAPGGLAEKRRLFVALAAEMLGADAWVWLVSTHDPATNKFDVVVTELAGINQEWFAEWSVKRTQDPDRYGEPYVASVVPLLVPGKAITCTRQNLVPDTEWYAHPHVVHDRIGECGLDHFLYTVYVNHDQSCSSGLGLHRRHGREAFSLREKRMFHLLSSEVVWIHNQILPNSATAGALDQLSQRHREILQLALHGYRTSEVAEKMHLSPHTVTGYLSDLYRILGIANRTELLQRFVYGDGGDGARKGVEYGH